MRILVAGASGFIGGCLLETLGRHLVTGTYLSRRKDGMSRLDLLDRQQVNACLEQLEPDVVVHCAARPSVDWAELNPVEARRINLGMTANLLEAVGRIGSRLTFLSTDYVFDGAAGPYDESATANPINVYGRLKLECERKVLDSPAHLVVRTTNVYGYDTESKNFLMAVLSELALRKAVRVAVDQLGTPTFVDDLCEATRELIERGAAGIFHVAGPEAMDRAEWARAAARAFGLDERLVQGVSTAELGQPAPRPKRAGLISQRLSQVTHLKLRTLAEGLTRMRAVKQSSQVKAW